METRITTKPTAASRRAVGGLWARVVRGEASEAGVSKGIVAWEIILVSAVHPKREHEW
jgi:hypothetical protein